MNSTEPSAAPTVAALVSGRRRRRVRAHQCTTCRTPWALRVVDHPAGKVIVCTHCGAVRSSTRARLGDSTTSAAPTASRRLRALPAAGGT